MESYVHKGIFTTKALQWSFFHFFKLYFKNILNSIEFPLGSIFCTTNNFVKKLTTVKTLQEKYFVNNRTIFIVEIRNYAMEWCHQ